MTFLLREFVRSVLVEGRADDLKTKVEKLPADGTVFFHFSDLNKLGINPKSGFETPIAVCGYPLDEAHKFQLLNRANMFAQDRAFVHFFKARNPDKVVYFGDLTYESAFRLWDRVESANGLQNGGFHEEMEIINGGPIRRRRRGEQIGFANSESTEMCAKAFWSLCYQQWKGRPVQWSRALINAGIEGIVDPGYGIFHQNEPDQGAFFSGAFVDQILTLDNTNMQLGSIDLQAAVAKYMKDIGALNKNKASFYGKFLERTQGLAREFKKLDWRFTYSLESLIHEDDDPSAAQQLWEKIQVAFEHPGAQKSKVIYFLKNLTVPG